MSRRVEVTKEILADLVRNIRNQMKTLQYEEYKLLMLIDWYEPNLGKVVQNGEIVNDGIKDL